MIMENTKLKLKNKSNGGNDNIEDIKDLMGLPVENLISIYKKCNKTELLDLIVKKTERLAYKIAGSFKNIQVERKDIQQVALTALIIAVNRFEPESNIKFSTFAFYYIKGEILHFIRDSGLIKKPRWLSKLNKIFSDYVNDYEMENNHYPTIEEISKGINIPVKGINEFLKAREVLFYNNSHDKNEKEIGFSYDRGLIKSKEYKSFELVLEDKIILWDAIDRLCSLNRKILVLSYFLGFSQKEIGEKVGISQKSVSRKIKESISALKEYLT
jgi:RNA polymerase sigma-B factor